jgi:hypothetical protein
MPLTSVLAYKNNIGGSLKARKKALQSPLPFFTRSTHHHHHSRHGKRGVKRTATSSSRTTYYYSNNTNYDHCLILAGVVLFGLLFWAGLIWRVIEAGDHHHQHHNRISMKHLHPQTHNNIRLSWWQRLLPGHYSEPKNWFDKLDELEDIQRI